ncbi:MAG: adenosylcobalamin-dependent ribonucleoside-diphosphate reductase [Candidatus Nitrosocaldaceae archaeon]
MADAELNKTLVITTIRKRDGRLVKFEKEKITNAIYKALLATNRADYRLAEELAEKTVSKLVEHGYDANKIPSVEDVQDIVESILIEEGLAETAKAYILYRHERRKIREEKMKILEKNTLDELDKRLDLDPLKILAARYLIRDENGKIIESPKQLFERVAILVTLPDILRDTRVYSNGNERIDVKIEDYIDKFDEKFSIGVYKLNKWHFEAFLRLYKELSKLGYAKVKLDELLYMLQNNEFAMYEDKIREYYELMTSMDFLPNSPTLMNAGARLGQLSACFVLDMQDDMYDIMKASTDAALIFKSGGGVGINYSNLRPEGDIVASTSGVASGPTSFMRIIDTVTDVVKQGGKRRGANMGILEVWHPDIEKFITIKTKPGVLENFNISVGLWEDFWQVWENNERYPLRNPRNGKIVKYVDARQLLDIIAVSAWNSAEPGVIFLDNMNKHNVMKRAQGLLRATNPCGEQSLYPYESCNLGSINLSNMVKRRIDGEYEFDWQKYEQTIRLATRFLDNIIDVNKYPIEEIDVASKLSRRIGLGVMGLADLLFKLKIAYNSKEGYEFMNRLAEALTYYSMDESVEIAKSRNAFPLYNESAYINGELPIDYSGGLLDWQALIEKIKKYGIRNSQTTTVAPTGTISMIADCSSGIEPIFALVFEKIVTVGRFMYINKRFEEVLKKHGLYNEELLVRIANNYGSIKGLGLPFEEIFVTAMDMHWADHIMAQAIWQKWISNAIAKTINMPNDATVEDVKSSYLLAYALGLKGITVYRDGSRNQQVLHVTSERKEKTYEINPSSYVLEYIINHIDEEVYKEISRSLKGREPTYSNIPKDKEFVCPICKGKVVFSEGCNLCIDCGWSSCMSS